MQAYRKLTIYGEIVERLADDFARRFYPALRWILLDPDEVQLFYGERVQMELLPGFQELFATLLQDVLTVATNQVLRHAEGEGPGTGPGMREFAWTTTHRHEQNSGTALGRNKKPACKQYGLEVPRNSKKPKGRNGTHK
jgi:hypothetical protein